MRFIRSAKSDPFFLYLPYSMPHLPVSAPESRRGRSRAGLYGDVIETLDWSVGEILRALAEQGLDRNTMVVFASDNGPWHNLPPASESLASFAGPESYGLTKFQWTWRPRSTCFRP